MDSLSVKATKQTPEIFLNAKEGLMKFVGRSRPEDAFLFYKPIIDWIKQYGNNPKHQTTVVFNLEYFNSSSTKILKSIFENLKKISTKGKELVIEWHFEQEDEDMQEVGEELASLYELPFTFKPY